MHLAGLIGLPASTVGRVLRRRDVPPLSATDPITGLPVRRRHTGIRYERPRPGDLPHVDVKKLGRVPDDGGGWRVHGRTEAARSRASATTSCTSRWTTAPARPTSRPCPTRRTRPCAVFLHRTVAWSRDRRVHDCRRRRRHPAFHQADAVAQRVEQSLRRADLVPGGRHPALGPTHT